MIPFLRLTDTTAPLADELKAAAARVIDSGWYLNGPETKAFEQELAASVDSEVPAVACSNGLDALRLIFRGLIELGRLKPGDAVLVPANTYIASILPLTEFGLKPILIEPDKWDFCIYTKMVCCDRPEVKALLVVHLYGNPAWNSSLKFFAERNNWIVIEDNAQAIGAEAMSEGLNGTRKCGNLGHAAAFSFYPTKNIGALGDAGAVVTPDEELAKTIRALANYGSDRRYHNIYQGFNCRMDEIQAAFLRVKLRHLREECEARREIAEIYDKEITNPLIRKPVIFSDSYQVWHQYPVLVDDRDRFREYLEKKGVGSDIHYATPPHRQPCYEGVLTGNYPITDRLAECEVSLPIANLSPSTAREIARIINDYK